MARISREQRTTYALAVGILLFSVALLLLRYQEEKIVILGTELSWPWLKILYEAFAWLSIAGSIVAIAAIFIRRIEEGLKDLLTRRPTSRPQAVVQISLFFLSLWIYVLTWTDGLRAASGDELSSNVVLWMGLVWFLIIASPIWKLRHAFRLLLGM